MNTPASLTSDATWVWIPGLTRKTNLYLAFRLQPDIAAADLWRPAGLRISAGSLYRLWCNGHYLGRGPVRSWPGHPGLDTHDLMPWLKPGRNVISALVHFFGERVGGYPICDPGFYVDGNLAGRNAASGSAAWEVCRLTCWDTDSPGISLYNGFTEDVALGGASGYNPAVWEHGEGEGWQPAVGVKGPEVKGWEPRQIPFLREMPLTEPARILVAGTFTAPPAGANDTLAKRMAAEVHRPAGPGQIQLSGKSWPVTLAPADGSFLILDAGRMVAGAASFRIRAESAGEIRLGYSDRLLLGSRCFAEGRDRLDSDPFANVVLQMNPDHGGVNNEVDRFRVHPGQHTWQGTVVIHGFRYLKLSLTGFSGKVVIDDVRAQEIVYPVAERGSFRCSDPVLNGAWEAARLTARLCMADTFMDNCSRERQQYGGDGRQQALMAYAAFGDTRLARQFLCQHAQGLRADGAIQSGGPWCWDQIIPAWTLHWLEAIREYAENSGDRTVFKELAETMCTALDWYPRYLAADGLLEIKELWGWGGAPGGVLWNFIDWQGFDGQLKGDAARLVLNVLYFGALETAAGILAETGDAESAKKYRQQREQLRQALRPMLDRDMPDPVLREFVLTSAAITGLCRGRLEPVAKAAVDGTFTSDFLYIFLTLMALEQEGFTGEALAMIRTACAPMLADGTGTFYETRQARENRSRAVCQGVGGFPVYFLPRLVLGLRDISAVRKTVRLAPPAPGIASAECTWPLPGGEIRAVLSTVNGKPEVTVTVPPGWSVSR